jgi:hypothetical protein
MFHKRKYTPVNPQKYVGDHSNIIMRSSWETKFAIWCDKNPSVLKWSSEETIVPYISPVDNRYHRYFIDFKIQIRNSSGTIKTYLVEVKPLKQTQPPIKPSRKTKRFLQEVMTYGVNEAKWKYATEYAKDRGWEFIIITEKELGIK